MVCNPNMTPLTSLPFPTVGDGDKAVVIVSATLIKVGFISAARLGMHVPKGLDTTGPKETIGFSR